MLFGIFITNLTVSPVIFVILAILITFEKIYLLGSYEGVLGKPRRTLKSQPDGL